MAKKEIRESPTAMSGENIAKIGVILGYVNLAIFVLALCATLVLILLGPSIESVFLEMAP